MDEVSHYLGRIQDATGRLLVTSAAVTDAQAREPSLLPGWTRGHVLTHIARNADGMVNLLRGARTGTPIPMYPSTRARDDDIMAGADRPAVDLATDVRESAEAFAAAAASLPGDAWTAEVRALRGPSFPAFGLLDRRLSEVEIHHVDLAAGYRPADWPGEFVTDALDRVADSFTGRDDAPRCLIWATGAPHGYRIGPTEAATPRVIVSGPAADLLAWLLGRDSGTTLRVSGETSTVPGMPPWR
jgi:maleylpyruvate isomerase